MRKLLIFTVVIIAILSVGCMQNKMDAWWGKHVYNVLERKNISTYFYQLNKNNWTRWDFILHFVNSDTPMELRAPFFGFAHFEPKNEKIKEKYTKKDSLYYVNKNDFKITKISRWYYIDIQMLPRKTERGKQIAKAFKDSYYYTIRQTLNRINKDFDETFKECTDLSACPKSAEGKNNTIIVKFVETAPPPETEDEIYGKLLYIDTYNNKTVRTVNLHYVPKCFYYTYLPMSTIKKLNLNKEKAKMLRDIKKKLKKLDKSYLNHEIDFAEYKEQRKELLEKSCIKIPESIIKTDFKITGAKEFGWERKEYITLPEKILYNIQRDIFRTALANWSIFDAKKIWKINPIEPHKELLKEVTKEWFERYNLPMRVFPEDLKIKD